MARDPQDMPEQLPAAREMLAEVHAAYGDLVARGATAFMAHLARRGKVPR